MSSNVHVILCVNILTEVKVKGCSVQGVVMEKARSPSFCSHDVGSRDGSRLKTTSVVDHVHEM